MHLRKLLIFLTFVLVPSQTYAQKAIGLDIENYFNQLEALYTNEKPDMQAIKTYLEPYLTDDFAMHLLTKHNRGEDIKEINQTKEEFLADFDDTSEILTKSSLKHTISNINIIEDGNAAEVKYSSLFKGDVIIDGQNLALNTEKGMVRFKSLSICTALFRVENDTIKSYRGDCKVDTIYEKPVERIE